MNRSMGVFGDLPLRDEDLDKPMVWVDDDGVAHYRASALGGCETAMIAVRSGFQAMAPPKTMQDRFNEGHLHEPDIVRRANTEFGLEVFAKDPATGKQWTVQVPVTSRAVINGHTDGKCLGTILDSHGDPLEDWPHHDTFRVFEAKTMSDAAFKRWEAMTWEQRWVAYPGYAKQMTCYVTGMSIIDGVDYEDWVYAVKNKESGQILIEPGHGLPWPLDDIKGQVLRIEAHVRQGLPFPDVCLPRSQWPCPVYYVGPCGNDTRASLDERVEEIVEALAVTYDEARDAEKVAKAARQQARNEIVKHLDDGKFETPSWKVTYTERAKTGTTNVERFNMEQFVADHPDLAEKYNETEEVETWSSERLTITKIKQPKTPKSK